MSTDAKECPFCGEMIKAAAKKCRYCMEWLPGQSREAVLDALVRGEKISTGDLSAVRGVGGGEKAPRAGSVDVDGALISTPGDVALGTKTRDEQYEIALNWDALGKPGMRDFDLAERDLAGTNLAPQADLRKANLSGANLKEADLSRSYLDEADLRRANLEGAKLSAASLWGTDLRGARYDSQTAWPQGFNFQISGAIGPGAEASRADLGGADLRGANLRGANLRSADLRGAELSGADLSGAHLRRARYTSDTKWPDNFDPRAAGAILVGEKGDS